MIPLCNDALITFLTEKGYSPTLQLQTDQIILVLKISGAEYPLFIRIIPEGQVLQLLVFIPCSLKETTLTELSRLLHLLNKEMDIPGFGMDEDGGVIFYRITIPSLDSMINTKLIETYLKSMETICRSFTPVINAVARGGMTFETVKNNARQAAKK